MNARFQALEHCQKGFESRLAEVLQALRELPEVQWLQSYVTGDKLYCVYIAPNEELIREHARQGGFPANRISQVMNIIDPTTAGVSVCPILFQTRDCLHEYTH